MKRLISRLQRRRVLRTAFSVPSTAHPFLEPYLPYYDPVRDDPAFKELLAEIE